MIIPTRGRAATLGRCVGALARQETDAAFEVLVGIDGEDAGEADAATRAWSEGGGREGDLCVLAGPRAGQAAVRNRLLERARGRVIVFLNDDVIPDAGLLAAHLDAQREAGERTPPPIIIGEARWRVHPGDRLIDRMIRETSMVFFYDRMRDDPDPRRDWGFRHAWMLNLSVIAAAVRGVGGVAVFPSTYGYEDDDLAFRLRERFDSPVLYRPGAGGVHDHRIGVAAYLAREYRLGYAAWGFAGASPACALAMFGRDVRARDEVEYAREFVGRERPPASRVLGSMRAWDELDAGVLDGPGWPLVRESLYQQHLPLKRWMWRRGLLDASAGHGEAIDAAMSELAGRGRAL